MPIYAYRCAECGHTKDVLRKLSDPPLVTCPACGAEAFTKQLTAAGFQLKGSGWYATDFRNNGAKNGAAKPAADGSGGAPKSGDGAPKSGDGAPKSADGAPKSADGAPAVTGTASAASSEGSSGTSAACGGSCTCH